MTSHWLDIGHPCHLLPLTNSILYFVILALCFVLSPLLVVYYLLSPVHNMALT